MSLLWVTDRVQMKKPQESILELGDEVQSKRRKLRKAKRRQAPYIF